MEEGRVMRLYVDARLPWGSGIGRYVASVLPHMISDRPDWTFVLGVGSDNNHPDLAAISNAANVDVKHLDIAPFGLPEQRELARAVGPCDLAWFTNYWVPFFWRSPFVVTVHDLLHLRRDLFPAPMLKRAASQLMMAHLRRNARGIICVSEFTRQEFERRIGVPRTSTVIHHGSDHFPMAQTPFTKTKTALIVGAPKQHKNMEMAIEAWTAAAPAAPWRLNVVSPGDALRSSVKLGATHDSVQFHTGLSNAELSRLYQQAAIVLFPTKYEGFGFPVIESALNGARILASTADAVREVAKDMDVRFLDPGDKTAWISAIREATVLPLPTDTDPVIAGNLKAAQNYQWCKSARNTVEFIESYSQPNRGAQP